MMLKKIATISMVSVSALALSGCLTLPGEFTSEAVINADGTYSFSYSGDVQVITLAMMMMEEAKSKTNYEFKPYCYGEVGSSIYYDRYASPEYGAAQAVEAVEMPSDAAADAAAADAGAAAAEAATEAASAAAADAAASDGAYAEEPNPYAERECTSEEVAAQRKQYDDEIARKTKEAEEMQAMLGGINPADPATIKQFTDRLERQRGWESVQWVQAGTFRVVYKTSGTLNDNFGFPLIADLPTGQPFLTITRWDDNKVQVSAPAFVNNTNASGSMAMMSGIMGGGAGTSKEMEQLGLKQTNGTFTVRTNGTIVTNNTETGPTNEGGMKVMRWTVNGGSAAGAPVTLIQL